METRVGVEEDEAVMMEMEARRVRVGLADVTEDVVAVGADASFNDSTEEKSYGEGDARADRMDGSGATTSCEWNPQMKQT